MCAAQVQGCWGSPCARRGGVSELEAGARLRAPLVAERRAEIREACDRDTPLRQRSNSGQSTGRDRSRGFRGDALAEPGTGSSCHSGMHVVVAQGLGIGRKRFISGSEAAQLQSSQDADLLVYSSITSSQSPSRMVA